MRQHDTPETVVSRLNAELVKVMQTPDLKAKLTSDASIPVGSTPPQFAAYFRSEVEKWKKVIK